MPAALDSSLPITLIVVAGVVAGGALLLDVAALWLVDWRMSIMRISASIEPAHMSTSSRVARYVPVTGRDMEWLIIHPL